ncbi:ComF family protein [Clostridium rectalis]|uniref:ComF family protein n=1 Tax=Clostridium rectalis TaxID=2040295 RepID=UPI001FA98C73|nr:ComF family protein [Clostridium rectalis]
MKCALCRDITKDSYLCNLCKKRLKFCNEEFTIESYNYKFICNSVCYYSYSMLELILALKYKSDFKAGEEIANLMIVKIKEKDIPVDVITYVPSSHKALKSRGYNQSRFLAKNIGDKINKPVCSCLKKSKGTKDQIGLSGKDRWNNIKDSFYLKGINKIKNKNVLLVDDVITTGATAFYCAKTLSDSGAKEIFILTAAKSDV